MKNLTYLNQTDLKKAISVVCSAFDIELSRLHLNDDRSNLIMGVFTEWYYSKDLHSYWILVNMYDMTDQILKSTALRDFVLNLAERANTMMTVQHINYDTLLDEVVTSVCRNKVNPSTEHQSLLVQELNDSIYVSPTVLRVLL